MTKEERELLVNMADVLADVLHFWKQSNARRRVASQTSGVMSPAEVQDLRHEMHLIDLCEGKMRRSLDAVLTEERRDADRVRRQENRRIRDCLVDAFARKPKDEGR